MNKKPKISIGFAVLSHQNPAQLYRLLQKLTDIFEGPKIVCHHDFYQCPMNTENFPDNVEFVKPNIRTAWGDWSVSKAMILILKRFLKSSNPPDWIIFLSGADYPIKPAKEIYKHFEQTGYDAFVSSKKVDKENLDTQEEKNKYNRYIPSTFQYPSVFHLIQFFREGRIRKKPILVKNERYTRFLTPFSNTFHCYTGSQWFCANRKACRKILSFYKRNWRTNWHFKRTLIADEGYFLTILQNDKELNIFNDNFRYTDWSDPKSGPHPKTLSIEDFPRLVNSNAHFARKFNPQKDSTILDRLDQFIAS